jgi:glycosyltransferase involved in cell wall biosynthesis
MNPASTTRAQHIAIIMHDFSTGGSERIAIRLANQWVREGRQVTILCGTTDGPARALIEPGVAIERAGIETRRSMLSRLYLAKRLTENVRRLVPDLIFVPGNFHFPVIAALYGFIGRDRPVMVCKLSNPLFGPSRWFKKLLSGRIDAFVAMSDGLSREARKTLSGARIATLPEPILEAPLAVSEADPTSKLIVCAGRLVDQKNFSLAIQAFRHANAAGDMRMLILGEGPQRRKLEREIRRSGLGGHVHFGGHVSDIGPTLTKARLLLMTSKYEGYPAVLVEALARGVPVVTTDCSPAIREIVFDAGFGVVSTSDPSSLAAAITCVVRRNMPDPAKLAPLVGRHRIDMVALDYLDLFDELANGRRGISSASYSGNEAIHDRLPVVDECGLSEARQDALP